MMQVQCLDAAREAARLVARGDEANARQAAARVGPQGAALVVRRDGSFAIARVSATSRLLPAITIAAEAVSAVEPGQ